MGRKGYDQFTSDLRDSQEAVQHVAAFMQRQGRAVVFPPVRVAPEGADYKDYLDDADMYLLKPVQVKGSSRTFGSMAEFGFPMITVDEDYKIRRQDINPPTGYWIVSKDFSGGIYVPWDSRPQWDYFKAVDDTQGGRECIFRRCPKEYCYYVLFSA